MHFCNTLPIFLSFVGLVALPWCCRAAQDVNVLPKTPRSAAKSARPATSLIRSLSLHDRIAQLIVVRGYGDYPPADNAEYRRFTRWIREDHVGGFIVAGRIQN